MPAKKTIKRGPSWGEVADYEYHVDNVRKLAVQIAKETRTYENETGMAMADGDTFVANVMPLVNRMKTELSKINAYTRKYRRV